MYYSDLKDFVYESDLEDFCGGGQTVLVSTIHKSKGREFDSVYMLLDDEKADTEEKRRKLYVGLTRARHNLFIHCNSDIFPPIKSQNIEYKHDNSEYDTPDEIVLQLGLRDMYLDFFKRRKRIVLSLVSGMPLEYNDGYLLLPSGDRIASLSRQKREEIKAWEEKGFSVKSAKVNFIVAWRGKDKDTGQPDQEETAVILPELLLKRNSGH